VGVVTEGALAGWRVLELCESAAASFCAKVLSDLGADVVKVEPPSGDPQRRRLPLRSGAVGLDASAGFLYLNTGKQSVVLGESSADRTRLAELVTEADIVVTDGRSPFLVGLRDGAAPTIWATIAPFGSTGPYATYRANHLIAFHAGGEGSIMPSGPGFTRFPDRAPIQLGSDVADADAGWNAAVAVLAACYARPHRTRGLAVDVSVQESQLTLNRTRISRFTNDGVVLSREGNRYGIAGMLLCQDGYVQLSGMRDEHWERLIAMQEGAAFADERFATASLRAAHQAELGESLAQWCAERPRSEVIRVLALAGCPIGPYATPDDLIASAQLEHRAFFQAVEHESAGRLTLPGVPYHFSRTPVQLQPAPGLGSSLGFRPPPVELPPSAPRAQGDGRLLEGVRIVDFTWAAAGPYATLLLALLGAEVVKVESSRRPDPARRGFLADYGGTNRSPNFNELNLNKLSFQVDLTRPVGLDLVRRLIARADVVVDNFRPGVMARLGLGPEVLLADHPDLVVASSSGSGSTGPEASSAGLASVFGAAGGLSNQTGYDDGPPSEIGESTDYRSANALAVAILAALLHRTRTGEGQHVDLSSREVVIASAPDALLAHLVGATWEPRIGNRHREMSPHDVYRCTGVDEWLAVAVRDEDEWAGLCRALAVDDWVQTYSSPAARRHASELIDRAISAWTATRSKEEAFHLLQDAGVPAAPVMSNADLAGDAHLAARGVFCEVVHPEIGRQRVLAAPWHFSDDVCGVRRHGPLLGGDNRFVLEQLLEIPAGWEPADEDVLR
jgi:crotonobetainyl-CoA:carnitine CoA-transferase CaiB-like acyl-CoA transferase